MLLLCLTVLTGIGSASADSLIRDRDNDTKVTTEASADEDTYRVTAGGTEILTGTSSTLQCNVDITVPAEAYGVAWNGSAEAPTKDAIYDQIQSLNDHASVTLTGSGTYLSLSDQEITVDALTESDISDLSHTANTNAETICTGSTSYLDGEGNCDDISSAYEPAGITESDISDLQTYLLAESNNLSSVVTWANVPDANVTQSSVTQHQAALAITESQISDLSHTTDSNANTLCTGDDVYLSGEGNCNTVTGGGGGGDPDQNLFETVAVSGESDVVADTTTDTLTIAGGSGITITTDAGADTVTIADDDASKTCPIPYSTQWAEESGSMNAGTSSGIQYSFGNGNTAAHGIHQPCSGTVVMMSINCEGLGTGVGRVQMAVNGTAQGTGCEVSAPTSNNGGSYDDSCSIAFSAGDELTARTTVTDTAADGCTITWWIEYD